MLLYMSNLCESDLPTLPKYTRNDNNALCSAYILGKCQGQICKKYPEGHVSVSDVTDAFARDLSHMLTVGVEFWLAMEPPTT